tara:strand:- start:2332 stop:3519 length:1188 start_codon:yes stop_codon:yes gene_type:complete
MTAPLEGIRVIEFGNFIAGPFCGMLLADMGAEVIKIEPMSGDLARAIPPIIDGKSAAFTTLNRNKKSLALDLKSNRGRSLALEILKSANAIIENNRPGVMQRLGLGEEDIKKINNKIIYTSVSGFGQTGELKNRAGINLIIEALSGTLSVMGEKGEIPPRPGLQTADILGAMFAAYSTLAGLVGQIKYNQGMYADVSLIEASIASAVWETTEYLSSGIVPEQLGHSHRASAPYQLFETNDKRYIAVGAPSDAHFKRLMDILGLNDLVENPKFISYSSRKENENDLVPLVANKIKDWDSSNLEIQLTESGIPCGCVKNYKEALSNPHSVERQLVTEISDGQGAKLKTIRNPVLINNKPINIVNLAPKLGEHSFEILNEVGIDENVFSKLVSDGITI